jgi:hypothetical protein
MPAKQTSLREVLVVEQKDLSLRRRWFQSDYFDLFTWQDAAGQVTKFQLCYDVGRNERALVWSRSEGTYHDGVDPGDAVGGHGQTPILVPDGKFESGAVVPRFRLESAAIPAELRDLVLAKMREHLLAQYRLKVGRGRVRRERWQRRGTEGKGAPEN